MPRGAHAAAGIAAADPAAHIRDQLRAAAALAGCQPGRPQAIAASIGLLERHFPAALGAWESAERAQERVSLALILQLRYRDSAQIADSARRAAAAITIDYAP